MKTKLDKTKLYFEYTEDVMAFKELMKRVRKLVARRNKSKENK